MRVDQDVLETLERAEVAGQSLFLPPQMPRPLYVRTNKVLEAAGGRWDRREKAHLFPESAADAVDAILLTGTVTAPADFGYFPTPSPVVERLIALAELAPGMAVLEPSAGKGAIASALADAGCVVDCMELQPENTAVLEAAGFARSVRAADFLATVPSPDYDRVVMNPPFARQADIAHVRHALRYVRPGGRLVAVMSNSVTFRQTRAAQDFRELVEVRGGIIEDLPSGSFRESGTGVEAVIVVIPA